MKEKRKKVLKVDIEESVYNYLYSLKGFDIPQLTEMTCEHS